MFLKPIIFSFGIANKTKTITFDYFVKDNEYFSKIFIAQTGFYALPTSDKVAILSIDEYAYFLKLMSFAVFGSDTNYYDALKPKYNDFVDDVAIRLDKPKDAQYLVYTIRLKFTKPLEYENCSDNDKKSSYFSLSRHDLLYLITQIDRDIDYIIALKASGKSG